ncbi:hypothetical protein J4437_07305 [Candidatus Woesearchaeota archaeon]|nr:hypothetical protein [uncultured archaeon]MBS3124405.1 hypothetical protein [Candidatus Woesearchaeota archaeon]
MLKHTDRFYKVYTGLPLEERKIPIVIIEDMPINWNLAREEIDNNTERGEKILKTLIELEII